MSPTLLEGVAVLVVIAVAWQLGVRLAPEIMGILRHAIEQLNENNVNSPISDGEHIQASPEKEQKNDPANEPTQ